MLTDETEGVETVSDGTAGNAEARRRKATPATSCERRFACERVRGAAVRAGVRFSGSVEQGRHGLHVLVLDLGAAHPGRGARLRLRPELGRQRKGHGGEGEGNGEAHLEEVDGEAGRARGGRRRPNGARGGEAELGAARSSWKDALGAATSEAPGSVGWQARTKYSPVVLLARGGRRWRPESRRRRTEPFGFHGDGGS